ncbi:MAG: hypothetical protein EA341_02650 [Mongoliibacter sp.]|uniref:IPT/TIG domain-containing protein n=1 Tax=Mongoliibacter sp. TaxID=2022438 RepID=UPI0012F418B3|nr:IPT/TIG domain-containing protein [Mongoliibacter sp.]TVP52781.1 MAG: hypothetical protein EA341_02650 [Mongoliibacter sp.]
MRLKYFLVGLLSLLLWSCESEVDEAQKAPNVQTINAEVIASGGVVLHGELNNTAKISDHGFLITEDSTVWNTTLFKLRMGKPAQSGAFSYVLDQLIYPDKKYFFKAFIDTEQGVKYGAVKSFLSKGSKDPVILKVNPEKAHLETWISIHGKNLGNDPSFTQVRFGDIATYYWNVVSDSLVEALIPGNIRSAAFDINVSVSGKTVSIPYSLHRPEIHAIESEPVKIGSPFKILGNHFDSIPERNEVFVGDIQLNLLKASRKELEVIIPNDLKQSKQPIRVKSQLQEVVSDFDLILAQPVILEVPACAQTWDEVLIKGKNFHPEAYWNTVLIGGLEAEILGGNENEILVRVPRGPYPNGNAQIKVKVADLEYTFSKPMCIEDEWLMISDQLPFHFYGNVGAFSLNQKGYVISKSTDYNDPKDYLWEFNPSNQSWNKSALPVEEAYIGNVTTTNGKAYLYTGNDADNFWEFDPGSNKWSKKAKFPGAKRGAAIMFSLSGKAYVGLGRNTESWNIINYLDLYEYNPVTNSWKKMSNPPKELEGSGKASAVSLGTSAYVFGGAQDTGMNRLFRYEPSNDSWMSLASLPEAIQLQTGFAYNNKIYCATGVPIGGSARPDVWIYDPMSDNWEEGTSVGKVGRYRAFSFVINGQAYIGGGEGQGWGGSVINEFFQLKK